MVPTAPLRSRDGAASSTAWRRSRPQTLGQRQVQRRGRRAAPGRPGPGNIQRPPQVRGGRATGLRPSLARQLLQLGG